MSWWKKVWSRKSGIKLSPHHIVRLVDIIESGEDRTTDDEYFWKGIGVQTRVKETAKEMRKRELLVVTVEKAVGREHICAGRGLEDMPPCFFLTNRRVYPGCVSEEHKRREGQIAEEMGIKQGEQYTVRDLIERRKLTKFGKEQG